jgi:hypothetical protein
MTFTSRPIESFLPVERSSTRSIPAREIVVKVVTLP